MYQIEVSTDEIDYSIYRRYREFHELYQKINKKISQSIQFPKKNWNPFVSSVSPAIIQERIGKLDGNKYLNIEFLRLVLEEVSFNKNAVLILKLFHFIELKGTSNPILRKI